MAIAFLGVAAAMLASSLQRLPELHLLRTVGATRLQIAITLITESVLIELTGAIFGALIGLAAASYVLQVVLLNETGFDFPIQFRGSGAALVAALVVVSGVLAGLGPVLLVGRSRRAG